MAGCSRPETIIGVKSIIGSVYTQRYNRSKKTDGPLFRGRYKAIVVDHDAYLLHLSQYIHRNPLEAGIVQNLSDYEWSSYPAYIGSTRVKPWLYQKEVYGQWNVRGHYQKKYQNYVEGSETDKKIADFYHSKRQAPILGDEAFIKGVKKHIKECSNEILQAERRLAFPLKPLLRVLVTDYYGVSSVIIHAVKKGQGLKKQPRKIAMYLGQRLNDYRTNWQRFLD